MRLSGIFFNLIVISGVALALVSCNKKNATGQSAMPRPVAYHRVELPAAEYDTISVANVPLAVNHGANAEVEKRVDGNNWVTIDYSPIGIDAKLHLTLVPVTPATVQEVVDNRAERISLNLGSATPTVYDINPETAPSAVDVVSGRPSGKYFGQLIEAPGTSTPLQLLLTDAERHVITAALYYPEMTPATRDSLTQQLNYLREDLMHIIP